MVEKILGCKWSRFWMGSESRNPNHLKSDKWPPFCQKPFEIQTKVFGFWMVGTKAMAKALPFEIVYIFKKQIFNGFWMVRIQIPTVVMWLCFCRVLTNKDSIFNSKVYCSRVQYSNASQIIRGKYTAYIVGN